MRHDPRTPPPALRQPTSKIPGSFLLHSGNPGSDFVRPKIPGSFPVHSEIPGSALVHSDIPGSSPVRPGPFFAPRRTYGEPQFPRWTGNEPQFPRWTGNEPGIRLRAPDGRGRAPIRFCVASGPRRYRLRRRGKRAKCIKCPLQTALSRCGKRTGLPLRRHPQRGRYTRFVPWPAPVAGGAALSFRRPSSLPRVSRPWRLPRWSRPHRLPNSVRRWPL